MPSNLLSTGRLRACVSDISGSLSMPPVRKQDMRALHCTLVSRMVIIVAGGEDRAWEQQPGPKAPRGRIGSLAH